MNPLKIINLFEILVNKVAYVIATLGIRTIVSLCASFLIIIISIMLIDNWIGSFNTQTDHIIKVRQLVLNLQDLKYNIANAESAQRGFLITGRNAYIKPFDTAVAATKQNIAFVRYFYMHNPALAQNKLLENIDSSLDAKVGEMLSTIALAKSGNIKSAINLVNTDDGIRKMDFINQTISKISEELKKEINKEVKARYLDTFYARCLVIVSSFIWLALVVLIIKQMMKEMKAKENLKISLKDEITVCEKKLKDQNILVRTLALDYQSDVERERRKLSTELHDELGSIFTATKMDLSWLIKKLKEPIAQVSPNALIERLNKTTQYINTGIKFHRDIIQQLHPVGLSTLGFWVTLENMIKDAATRNNWILTLHLPNPDTVLDETIGLVAYRLVQESLNNANKYAQATAVEVNVMMDENHIKIEIEDNGVGMNLKAEKHNTFGISGMQNRILAIGGKFEIKSEPGKGVSILALIPLTISGI